MKKAARFLRSIFIVRTCATSTSRRVAMCNTFDLYRTPLDAGLEVTGRGRSLPPISTDIAESERH